MNRYFHRSKRLCIKICPTDGRPRHQDLFSRLLDDISSHVYVFFVSIEHFISQKARKLPEA